MSQQTKLSTVLRLPHRNYEALLAGRTVVIIPQAFIRMGQQFAICSSSSEMSLSEENFTIKAWARCEYCQSPTQPYSIEELAQITFWNPDELESFLAIRSGIFLAYLRAYWLLKPASYCLKFSGQFSALPETIEIHQIFPILKERYFNKRKLLNASVGDVLEELEVAINYLAIHNPAALPLQQDIEMVLNDFEFSETIDTNLQNSDLAWIRNIVHLGARSKELDEGKSNYQAGTDFENIVRQSLEFLGFEIDESHKGGAGGLDLFCSRPYPLVGECKAGKRIPSGTTEELLKLGAMHLSTEQFIAASKLVIGPGEPTPDMRTAAEKWRVSIINPMSLEKLVELKANYPGSIDLLELKQYLEPGQIDNRIQEYVDLVLSRLELRSKIVQTVKELTRDYRQQLEILEIKTYYNVKFSNNLGMELDVQKTHELLIELSSPFAGYLGRIQGSTMQSDRFYFLRDFPIKIISTNSANYPGA